MEKIGLVTITYNSADVIRGFLESTFAQTFQPKDWNSNSNGVYERYGKKKFYRRKFSTVLMKGKCYALIL